MFSRDLLRLCKFKSLEKNLFYCCEAWIFKKLPTLAICVQVPHGCKKKARLNRNYGRDCTTLI